MLNIDFIWQVLVYIKIVLWMLTCANECHNYKAHHSSPTNQWYSENVLVAFRSFPNLPRSKVIQNQYNDSMQADGKDIFGDAITILQTQHCQRNSNDKIRLANNTNLGRDGKDVNRNTTNIWLGNFIAGRRFIVFTTTKHTFKNKSTSPCLQIKFPFHRSWQTLYLTKQGALQVYKIKDLSSNGYTTYQQPSLQTKRLIE